MGERNKEIGELEIHPRIGEKEFTGLIVHRCNSTVSSVLDGFYWAKGSGNPVVICPECRQKWEIVAGGTEPKTVGDVV
jgi:hypothetical protein